jgi:hypothetical protein
MMIIVEQRVLVPCALYFPFTEHFAKKLPRL